MHHQLVPSYDKESFHSEVSQVQGGRLFEDLMALPLDVLLEVFGHLHPLDLLRLARTTKGLRGTLLKRSTVSVWRKTISQVEGLPPCPPDLDEPQYVNLAFDDHCHFCLTSDVNDIFWVCRVRCCGSFISDYDLGRKMPLTGESKSKAIFPYIVYPRPRPYKPGRILFYLPAAEQYLQELTELEEDDSMKTEWRIAKAEEQSRRLVHAALCETWSGHWVHKRSNEVNVLVICIASVAVAWTWHGWCWGRPQ